MSVIRMHTEQTPDPNAIDWVVRDGLITGAVSVDAANLEGQAILPPALAGLLSDGTVARIVIQDGRVTAVRSPTGEWPDIAPKIQAALVTALSHPGGIHLRRQRGLTDQLLADGVRQVLDNEIGDLVASHGGQIQLVDVTAGVVSLKLSGACRGCPSAGLTLKAGIENQLRQRFPDVQRVQSVSSDLPEPASERGTRRGLPIVAQDAPGPCPLDRDQGWWKSDDGET